MVPSPYGAFRQEREAILLRSDAQHWLRIMSETLELPQGISGLAP